MAIQTKQIVSFVTSDGAAFDSMAAAEAHEVMLEHKGAIELQVQSFLNKTEKVGRGRKMAETFATEFAAFLMTWDGEMVERTVFDPIKPVAEQAADEGQTDLVDAAAEADEVGEFA